MPFNPTNVERIEFAVALRSGEQPYYLIPSRADVQDMLQAMLNQTWSRVTNAPQIEEIDYGEEYGNDVCLRCAIDDPTVEAVVRIFNRDGLPTRAAALEDPSQIDFYLVRFQDGNGCRCLGVKTPSQFKATIGKKLIQLFGDELIVVQDNLFKLDREFDFLVLEEIVFIINPKQFLRIADVDQVLAELAPQHVANIANNLPVVNFDSMYFYAATHSRAQKLVSSIRKRPGLGQISLPQLWQACETNNIHMQERDGKLVPVPGHEIAFLELLDGRRYLYPFEGDQPERLRALRRSRVTD